jgi:hypothetical protein
MDNSLKSCYSNYEILRKFDEEINVIRNFGNSNNSNELLENLKRNIANVQAQVGYFNLKVEFDRIQENLNDMKNQINLVDEKLEHMRDEKLQITTTQYDNPDDKIREGLFDEILTLQTPQPVSQNLESSASGISKNYFFLLLLIPIAALISFLVIKFRRNSVSALRRNDIERLLKFHGTTENIDQPVEP